MIAEVFSVLLYNIALLVLLVLAYDLLSPVIGWRTATRSLATGLILGTIGVVVMLNPWHYAPGISIDTRTLLLCLSGFYFGPLPTLIVGVMTAGLRIVQGGAGMSAGLLGIASSAIIGLLWRRFRKKEHRGVQFSRLYLMGLTVHAAMLLLLLTLPENAGGPLLRKIALPVMLLYPLATALLGSLLDIRADHAAAYQRLAESEQELRHEIRMKEQAEAAIRVGESKFREYIEHSPIGVFVCDEQGDYQDVNSAAVRMTGFSREELLSMNIRDLVPTTQVEHVSDSFEEGLAVGEVSDILQFRRKDGSLGFWTVNAAAVSGSQFVGFTREITALVRAEQAARAEKERLRVTLQSIGEGVITTDTSGRIQMMNHIAEFLTGWPQAEAEGRPLPEVFHIIHEFSSQQCENPVEKVISSGEAVELANHTILVSRDNERRIIADSGAPIRNTDGTTIGVVLVFRDLTEETRIKENLQRAARLDALGVLAGGIAHDFNNLLGGIFGYTQLAIETAEQGGSCTPYLQEILGVFNRSRDLTQQLLTFSRGGKPSLQPRQLGSLIVDSTSFALSGSKTTAAFSIAPDLWLSDIDENQIAQVIDNIVINAQQAMPLGGTITITAENTRLEAEHVPALPNGEYVHIAVTDSGTGIEPRLLDKIFDPFFTTKLKGNGLGLATSYSVMRNHDGAVTVESVPGEGSTFHLYLPRSLQETLPEEEEAVFSHRGSGTVLVLDDDPNLRAIIGKMLKSMGYTPLEVDDGSDVVNLMRMFDQQSDLIDDTVGLELKAAILDLTVPGGMGGKEAIGIVRRSLPELPVFAVSGYSHDAVMSRPNDFGFTDSLVKPFRREDLEQLLAKHVGAGRNTGSG